ncbi:SulP family inorganic anion transporter [Yinghuangia aomiensis]
MNPTTAEHSARPVRRRPVADWFRTYRRDRFGTDTIGALTAWALIVPECVAYAQIAGVPPQNAFYGAPVALLAYVLFGTSRFLIVGATSAAAVLSAATVTEVSGDPKLAVALSAALAMVAGAVLVVAGLAKLGFLADFLSEPALLGFLFGMALTIVIRQCAKILGVSSGDGDFFERAWTLLRPRRRMARADARGRSGRAGRAVRVGTVGPAAAGLLGRAGCRDRRLRRDRP